LINDGNLKELLLSPRSRKNQNGYSTCTNLLKAMMAPVRPYGLIFSYTGGAQNILIGNYQFFEMD
jgi:hypothetical protein